MFDEAIEDCNRLIDLNQENAAAYYIRGCAYQKLSEEELCIADFTRVLQIDPTHVNAAYAKGAAENKRGNYLQAIQDYNMALKMDTSDKSANSTNQRRYRREDFNQQLDLSIGKISSEIQKNPQVTIQRVEQLKMINRDKLLLSPSGGKSHSRAGFGVILNSDED